MKIKIKTTALLGAVTLMVAGLASCSSDEPETVAASNGAISFSAVVPKASRAASTTTTSINKFIVYAFTDGKVYMDGVKVTRSGANWGYSPVVYWPSTPVNFYALSPEITNTPTMDPSTNGQISGYNNVGDVDLLYAVNMGETAKASPVMMNFRHALSRVDVLLSSSNADLTVKVANISLNSIATRGTFTFPHATTSANLPDNVGSWSDFQQVTNPLIYYSVDVSDFTTLTTTPVNLTENNLNVSFIIPQPLTDLTSVATGYTGNAIQVDCEIFDTKTGTKLWPNDATPSYQCVPETDCGRLMFSVTTSTIKSWEPGHAYVYNIKIDNPAVLHPIDFDVTVDEFIIDSTE